MDRAARISVRPDNPKKGKSAARYESYKRAATALEYVQLGGTKADLKYDIARGFVVVVEPNVARDRDDPGATAPAPATDVGAPEPAAARDDAEAPGPATEPPRAAAAT